MKETKFIGQNKAKWSEFESLLEQKTKDPNRLSELYVQITDDLSFSKSYYKNRLVRAYLNNLSQKIYLSVYKNKKTPLSKLSYFWKEELPYIIYQCRKELLLAFIIFAFASMVGALSVINDPDYAEVVTSPSYVHMTKENIKNGDPMAVYKDEEPLNMFLRIAWNNIRVSFNVFVLGAVGGIGSMFLLLLNGTMLGGFQFFFWGKGVFLESVITVWQHGTIEILCIIIAGGAGIVLGKGLIAPGTYPRLQSFQISARKGIMIMISIMPFIIIAAFIEGYITRLTEAPMIFRVSMILLSFAVMFGYYIYYPYKKFKSGFDAALKFEKPVESKDLNISTNKIKSGGEIFSEAFSVFTNNFGKFFLFAFIIGLLYGFLHLFYLKEESLYIDFYDFWSTVGSVLEQTFLNLFTFFKHSSEPLVLISNVFFIATIMYLSTKVVLKLNQHSFETKKSTVKLIFSSLFFAILINVTLLIPNWTVYLTFMLLVPLIAFLNVAVNAEDNFISGLRIGLSRVFSKFGESLLLWVMLIIIIAMFSLINTSTIVVWMVDFIGQNFLMDAEASHQFYTFISTFLGIGVFSLIFPIFFIAFGLHYFSINEQKTAKHLLYKIEQLVP